MVDSCSGTANILVLLTENMPILTAHYYLCNSNFQSRKSRDWTRAIPGFALKNGRKRAECNSNLQHYFFT